MPDISASQPLDESLTEESLKKWMNVVRSEATTLRQGMEELARRHNALLDDTRQSFGTVYDRSSSQSQEVDAKLQVLHDCVLQSQSVIEGLHAQAEDIKRSAGMTFEHHKKVIDAMTVTLNDKAEQVDQMLGACLQTERKLSVTLTSAEQNLEECIDKIDEVAK